MRGIALRLLAVLFTLLVASPASSAPPPRPNELHVGLGDRGMMFEFNDAFGDIFATIFSLGHLSYGETGGSPQFTAGYERWLNRWASLGASGAYVTSHRTVYWDDVRQSDEEQSLFVVMGDARAHWLRRPSVQLYSGLSLGIANWGYKYASHSSSEGGLAFQLTPIGVRIGRDLGAYAEFGLGHGSALRAGLSKRY